MATTKKPTAKAEAQPKKRRPRKVTLTQAWNAVAEKRQAVYQFGALVVEFDHLLKQRGTTDEKVLRKNLRANEVARERLRKRIVHLEATLARFDAQAQA